MGEGGIRYISEMKELIDKVNKYLEETGSKPLGGTVAYSGLRKEMKLMDGEKKDLHCFRYFVSVGKGLDDQLCYIYVDAKTNELEFLITPHIYERIRK